MRVSLVHYPNLVELLGKGWTESELCRIHNIHARRWNVELPGSAAGSDSFTVGQLKRLVEDLHGVDAADQVVRHRGRVLENEQTLASSGISDGSTVLLGLLKPLSTEKPSADADAGDKLRTAERNPSQTQTIAGEQSPQAASGEPWWTGSRISGPQGRPAAMQSDQPKASSPTAAAFSGAGATLGGGDRLNASALPSPSADELRQKRLARFG
eukprot:TRINITY_DN90473_c0_g1_i1.p2 TRINITY_DN90473_c0_g1~~TRINITY_DN90473_c0_g1_i1.p2  ORF type:complete len:212 (+),score=49.58 TRINITY_DN90473_c0_g1_i1:97-732(+)